MGRRRKTVEKKFRNSGSWMDWMMMYKFGG